MHKEHIHWSSGLKRTHTAEKQSSSNNADTDRGAPVGSSLLSSCLEGSKGLIRSRVDGKDHSSLAMSTGLAVEPGWIGAADGVVVCGWCGLGTNCHSGGRGASEPGGRGGKNRKEGDGRARVYTTGKRRAGARKGRLSYGMAPAFAAISQNKARSGER